MNPLKTNNPKGRLLTYQQVAENSTYMVVYHGKMRIIAEHGAVMMIQPYFH